MTAPDPNEPFDLDDIVRILGSRVQGRVVEVTYSTRRELAYLVEYVDATGNPAEQQWSHDQLSLVRSATTDAVEAEDNVVPLRRVVN